MHVTVRFFGIIGDIAKRKTQEVELPEGATVSELIATLAVENAGFAGIAKQVRVVADGENVPREHVLTAGCDVALIRAIGGGER